MRTIINRHHFIFAATFVALTIPDIARGAEPNQLSRFAPLKFMQTTGLTEDGRAFTGHISITELTFDSATQQLLASGHLIGRLPTGRTFHHRFEAIPTSLSQTATPDQISTQAICDILFLDLGPIFLDLLGLTLDLSPIELDLNAVSGAGNLVGNLLCAVTGLLDSLSLGAILESILQSILDALNAIL